MPPAEESQDMHDQIREVTELLEAIAEDRTLLLDLPEEDRTRLMKVAGEIYCPDVKQRRRLLKAKIKARKKEKISRDQEILNETGIRTLRSKPVFTTPNIFPPGEFEQQEVSDPDFREVVEPQN